MYEERFPRRADDWLKVMFVDVPEDTGFPGVPGDPQWWAWIRRRYAPSIGVATVRLPVSPPAGVRDGQPAIYLKADSIRVLAEELGVGILDLVAAVAAHEVAHHTLGHPLDRNVPQWEKEGSAQRASRLAMQAVSGNGSALASAGLRGVIAQVKLAEEQPAAYQQFPMGLPAHPDAATWVVGTQNSRRTFEVVLTADGKACDPKRVVVVPVTVGGSAGLRVGDSVELAGNRGLLVLPLQICSITTGGMVLFPGGPDASALPVAGHAPPSPAGVIPRDQHPWYQQQAWGPSLAHELNDCLHLLG